MENDTDQLTDINIIPFCKARQFAFENWYIQQVNKNALIKVCDFEDQRAGNKCIVRVKKIAPTGPEKFSFFRYQCDQLFFQRNCLVNSG